MVRLLLCLATCAAMALADVTFNVVGLREGPGDEFGVMINGKLNKLHTTAQTYPVWSAHLAGVNGPLEYEYVHMKKAGQAKEKAPRKLPAGAIHTPNEFFDRPHSIADLPPLPQVYESKMQQNSPFFREGYIGTLFIEGDEAAWKKINVGGVDNDPPAIKIKFQYIGANENIRINDAKLEISGGGTRGYNKLPYKFHFTEKNRFLNLDSLKLRNAETDASMMREKLYIDIMNSLGIPTQQSAYVRLYFNNKPVGLFVGLEEMKEHWVKTVLHPEAPKHKLGSLWKMDACCGYYANLGWTGPTTDKSMSGGYKNLLPGNNPKNDIMKDLIVLMADIKKYNPKTEKDPIGYWNKRIDLDEFLKSMAMEYLNGQWDGYWNAGSNYQMYNDPITGKWLWLPIDFDDTFGSSYSGKLQTYRKIPNKNEHGFERPLAQKLIIDTPAINARFEQILKEIVGYVYKPSALIPRVEAYKRMIYQDVAWDRVQPRLAKGESKDFTIQDLNKGVAKGRHGDWGIIDWIQKRTAQVEKDLKFKVVPGTPSKIERHVVTKLQSAYGIPPPAPKLPMSPAPAPAGDGAIDSKSGLPMPQDNGFGIDVNGQDSNTMSSAESLKGRWAALGTIMAVVALTL
ncbi:hypothetical protein KVV02_004247 [Mortierella alpina]|uniref:Coth protein-domain-containing protein n=1 Tax=Mortierella alpina TaxID=64518 RepID=A0A9P8A0P6_MORAP|nr:hypothetical protein KVV02_004247 [Mortierella alpina]